MRTRPWIACSIIAWPSLVRTFTFTTQQTTTRPRCWQPLAVSIGLGPQDPNDTTAQVELVEGVDYEVPNHEEYRLSRRSKLDEQCDEWFEEILEGPDGCLGSIASHARQRLVEPVPVLNDYEKDPADPDWTPFVKTRLPWTPLVPAFGLEQFGLPMPRRNAETWRHFDVAGMVSQRYQHESTQDVSTFDVVAVHDKLQNVGGWLGDDECAARLVYVNGYFVADLSKVTSVAQNVESADSIADDQHRQWLSRLTDGFTDELVAPVKNGDYMETSYKQLSRPNHNLGNATTQFAINTQQGTACFAALNTVKTRAVAYVNAPPSRNTNLANDERPKPVLIVNAITKSGGSPNNDGVSCHPRTLIVAGKGSRLSVVQSCVDLDNEADAFSAPKLYNGYTQVFVGAHANVTHAYLEESGGLVTPNVELNDDELPADDELKPREIEAQREALRDTHLEALDVHVLGEKGAYSGTVMSMGGSGRVRLAHSVTLLQPGAHAKVQGFSLSGGAQRADIKTNIHHVAQGTSSEQVQKNMIGGRATGSFRGRIRVEQAAQQTDSKQLSRTVLLSDRARAWAVPSLEIIADDVQCAHGATVSDLSEEELFYLRSRGLDVRNARNLLMYAFAGDVSAEIDPAVLGSLDGKVGLQRRIVQRLENMVPSGIRAVKADFQSI